MTLGNVQMLWLLLLLIPGLVVLIWGQRRFLARLRLFAKVFGRNRSEKNLASAFTFLKIASGLLAVIFMVLGLAMPRLGYTWQEQKSLARDVFLVLDVSASMGASDLSPSRLVHAKRKILDLLEQLKGTRIGLVIFAGQAFVQFPLTEDINAAKLFLDLIEPEMITARGTAIGSALRLALQSFARLSKNTAPGQKAIILLTDGEDKSSDPEGAAKEAQEQKIPIHILGIGTVSGAPVPDTDGSFKKDSTGNLILSRLNPGALQRLADISGGTYVASTVTDDDLNAILAHGIFGAGSNEFSETHQKKKIWQELFVWPLGFALGAFLLMLYFRRKEVLSLLRHQALLIWLFISAGLWVCYAGKLNAEPSKGVDAFNKKDYAGAVREFLQEEVDHPDDPKPAYNRGVADYMQGNYGRAAEAFSKASKAKDVRIREPALFNLGNALARQKKWDEAIKAYDQAMELNKKNPESSENKAWAEKMREMEQKQEQNQQNQQNKEDQQKQDGQQNKADQQKQDEQQNQDKQKQDGQQNQDSQQNSQKRQDDQKQDGQQNQNNQQSSQQKQEDQNHQDDQKNAPKDDGQEQDANPEDKIGASKEVREQEKDTDAKHVEEEKNKEHALQQDQKQKQEGEEKKAAAVPQRQKGLDDSAKELNNMETERLLRALDDRGPPVNYLPMSPEKPSKQAQEEEW